jgi:hypothetical protein
MGTSFCITTSRPVLRGSDYAGRWVKSMIDALMVAKITPLPGILSRITFFLLVFITIRAP